MQLNKTMYIDLVGTLPKIMHLRRVREAIAIDQITAQCVTHTIILFAFSHFFTWLHLLKLSKSLTKSSLSYPYFSDEKQA